MIFPAICWQISFGRHEQPLLRLGLVWVNVSLLPLMPWVATMGRE